MDGRADAAFAAAYADADRIPGWLTQAQARRLWEEARRLGGQAHVVEIGSHQGRSTLVLAAALAPGSRLTAIDPFDPGWRYGGLDTEALLRRNLAEQARAEMVEVVVRRSQEVRLTWRERVDLVFVDGKHDYWSVRDDLAWAYLLPGGGRLLVHDCFSSVGVTLAVLRVVLGSGSLRYAGRVGSLATLVRQPPSWSDRLAVLRELPWFVRNLAVKVLLRARMGRVAARLGHHDGADPY